MITLTRQALVLTERRSEYALFTDLVAMLAEDQEDDQKGRFQ